MFSKLKAHFIESASLVVKKSVAALIIFAAVAICYLPVARDGFVWDDNALILRDPLIRSWRLIPESFNHFLFIDATASDFYRPFQRLTYLADYAAFGLHPGPYHLISVLWHAAAAISFFIFAEEFLASFGIEERRRRLIALAGAAVWAIHPAQSAAVAYISGRADPLCATFGFLCSYLILRQARSSGVKAWIYLFLSFVALVLSLFSKEIGLVFPALLFCFFALKKNWLDLGKVAAITALACTIYFSLRAGAEHFPPPQLSPPAPAIVRPIIAARAVAEYAGLLLLPTNLHMDRDVETRPNGGNPASMARASWRELQTLVGIVLIAAFFYWMWRARRRNLPVFTCLLFALITYLPVSGIIALNATVAEHWIYLPSGFLFLAVAIEMAVLFPVGGAIGRSKLAFLSLFTTWLIFIGGRTFVRAFDWKDEQTFLQSAIAQGGDSARMLVNLGVLEMNEGKSEDAAVHLHAALQKKPDQPFAILNLGALALKQNDFKLARQLLTRATKLPLVDAQANELLAVLENKENKKVDLLRLRLAAHTGQPIWTIEKRYIQVLDESGNRPAAIAELINLLGTQWYRAESWQLLSQLETKAGHMDQAANALVQARAYDVHLGEH